jgi:hypothetical protein
VVEEEQAFSVEMKKWQVQFPGLPYYLSENFYHHHGLRFIAPETVRQYLSTRDFLDFGASIGDSLVVLKAYTTGRVISYELIPNTFHRPLKWAKAQCLIFNVGVAAAAGVVYVPRYGSTLISLSPWPRPISSD